MIHEPTPYTEVMAGRPPSKPAPTFGAQLAALRKARGFTQPQLAKLLGISVDMLTYYERRAKNPTLDFIQRCAETLDISATELIGGKPVKNGHKPGPKSRLMRQFEQVERLPKSDRELVGQLLNRFLNKAT
jgi:transcriptional regulator with XRE-family HTH domain